MQQQSIDDAISTETLLKGWELPLAEPKLTWHDLVQVMGQVGVTLAACGMLHIVM